MIRVVDPKNSSCYTFREDRDSAKKPRVGVRRFAAPPASVRPNAPLDERKTDG